MLAGARTKVGYWMFATTGVFRLVGSSMHDREMHRAQQNGQLVASECDVQEHLRLLEVTYRIDLRYRQDFQYIIQPGGTGEHLNAPVFGTQFDINL